MKRNLLALAAFAVGAIGFAVALLATQPVWTTPDWRVTLPAFVLAAAATAGSFLRREPTRWLGVLGVGMAAASTVLGWLLLMAIVAVVTAAVILVLSLVM